MGLTSELLSQFVTITKQPKQAKKETFVYGTTIEYEGQICVRLDGSDLVTRVSTTTDAKPGERVVVMIKDHMATITGNASSPSARTEDVQVVGGTVSGIREDLNVSEGYIADLQTNYITVDGILTAQNAAIENLETTKLDVSIANASYATIADLDATNATLYNLEGTYGSFVDLTTNRLTAVEGAIENIDATYANVDFSNIGQAAMEYFYSKSGLIDDVVVGDATISGRLSGVTISGDLIEANTLKANKLVILGSDGLYYKLNTDGMTTEKEQTDQNSINGNVIKAKSITASKIDVKDLVAFGATIGGFHITSESLYSGTKSTVGNTTRGVYLDKDGQVAVGDSTSFIKYYKDTDGSYRIAISADELKFSNGAVVSDILSHVKVAYDTDGSPILSLVSGKVQLKVTNSGVSIYENDTMSTYISNRMLNVDRVYATKESQVGPFVTAERANGNVGTRWVGGGNG